jgi:anthranilate/para-aminobenzoate synthase component II
MQIIENTISLDELKLMASNMFNNIVKSVIDVEQEVMVVDAMLHSDQEEYLLNLGSEQANLWGINLHPESFGTPDFIDI